MPISFGTDSEILALIGNRESLEKEETNAVFDESDGKRQNVGRIPDCVNQRSQQNPGGTRLFESHQQKHGAFQYKLS